MPNLCLDQNVLRSAELVIAARDEQNVFVLPDAAIMEMCKGDQWERATRTSLATLAQVPGRVRLTLGNGELLRFEHEHGRPVGYADLFDPEANTTIATLLREIAGGRVDGPAFTHLRETRDESLARVARGHLNNDENVASIRDLVPTIRDSLSPDALRRFRAGGITEEERIQVVSGFTAEIFTAIADDAFPDEVAVRLFEEKSFVARHLWLRVYAIVRWIELGGAENVRPERATNDVVDSHYILIGSYCDRLMTRETRVIDADRHMRTALAPDFNWRIDLSHLAAR
jgi:hypothetical protein